MEENSKKMEPVYTSISLWDSKAEHEVFQYLHKIIDTEHFYIFPHMPVSEVFKEFRKYDDFKNMYDKFCELVDSADYSGKHFELSHFDFTVYNKSAHLPVLIIEADGSQHKTNPSIMFFDRFKDYIAAQHEIPLVRLELYKKDMDIEAELVKKLKDKNLNDPYNYPIYCWNCGKKFIYQPKGTYGGFYYCRSCNKADTDKSVTASNNERNCPPLFIWDK